MSCLFIITARAGSKGIPGKNLQKIGGLSLIAWKTIPAKQACDEIPGSRLIISTDSLEMALEAQKYGAEVPFLRPDDLATDEASSETVIAHALARCETHYPEKRWDSIVLLEPSSPFATADHIRQAIDMQTMGCRDLVCGMREVRPHAVFVGDIGANGWMGPIVHKMNSRGSRRQDHPAQWTMNGAVYVFSTQMFKKTHSRYGSEDAYGMLMDDWHSIEIDVPADLELARYAYDKGHVKLPIAEPREHPMMEAIGNSRHMVYRR